MQTPGEPSALGSGLAWNLLLIPMGHMANLEPWICFSRRRGTSVQVTITFILLQQGPTLCPHWSRSAPSHKLPKNFVEMVQGSCCKANPNLPGAEAWEFPFRCGAPRPGQPSWQSPRPGSSRHRFWCLQNAAGRTCGAGTTATA